MKKRVLLLLIAVAVLSGCTRQGVSLDPAISGFIDHLKEQGVDGSLTIDAPDNADIEYVATYVISKFTSTRIISFFKCADIESAEINLSQAKNNPKMSGQARNGSIIMAATFYPPDEEAVKKISDLFLAYRFNEDS